MLDQNAAPKGFACRGFREVNEPAGGQELGRSARAGQTPTPRPRPIAVLPLST
jgi:hypothetical protein